MRLHSQQWASDQVGRSRNHQALKPISKHLVFWDASCHYFFFGTCFPIKIVGGRLEARSSKSRTLGRSRVQLWVTWVQFSPMLPPEMLDEATDISKLGNWCQHFFLGLGCVTRAGLVGSDIVPPCEDKWPVGQKAVAPWRYKSLDSKILKWMLCCLGFLSSTCWEYRYLPKKKRCRNTKSFGFFLMTFGRAGFCSPRSWNTKSNGDPLRPWHVNDKTEWIQDLIIMNYKLQVNVLSLWASEYPLSACKMYENSVKKNIDWDLPRIESYFMFFPVFCPFKQHIFACFCP